MWIQNVEAKHLFDGVNTTTLDVGLELVVKSIYFNLLELQLFVESEMNYLQRCQIIFHL